MKIRSLRRATYLALATSLAFWAIFQLSKIRAIQVASPFANDPYDAVGSFAFQIALALGFLSLARVVSIRDETGARARTPFILHGILLVELCVALSLIADIVAVARAWPLLFTQPLLLQLLGLGILVVLFCATAVLLIQAWRESGRPAALAPPDALGQSIRDCWNLVDTIAAWLTGWLPFLKPTRKWITFQVGRLARAWNRYLPFANPDLHPWQFAGVFAVIAGMLLMAGILVAEVLVEGPPASPVIALLLMLIFFVGETLVIFVGFLLFGGYLGLRPRL